MRTVAATLAMTCLLFTGCSREDADTAAANATPGAMSPKDLPGEPVGEMTPVANPSGLQYVDLEEGTGEPVPLDRPIRIHYTGYLTADGQKFEDSRTKNVPHQIVLNFPALLPAWKEGIAGMKAGGRRKLIVPPKLAYGQFGRPPLVPGNATIVYDVEVLSISTQPEPAATPEEPDFEPAG
jgi:FKBP-type peptidyl-prolyl cis-trans isomerase FkpA